MTSTDKGPWSLPVDSYRTALVQELFDRQVARAPDAIAVAAASGTLTYRELARSANQAATHLRRMGVGPEALVGVSTERGIETIRAMLAIFKAGGAYLPLSPALPAARREEITAEARPAVIVTDGTEFPGKNVLKIADLPGTTLPGTTLPGTTLPDRMQDRPPDPKPPGLDNLAYVIYTSGSTGRPKGVAVSHGSLAAQIQDAARAYRIDREDRVLQLAAIAFDTAVEQVLVALLGGATLMLPPPGTVAPTDLLGYLAERRVTVADLTPAYWHQLLALTTPDDGRLNSLRLMITGGEMASPEDCRAARRTVPGARLVNAYGLTETTITSTLAEVRESVPGRPVPAGLPLPHAQVMILGSHFEPVPAGEIYIGGRGVARGYVGQPGRTAERFIPNPYSTVPGGRMYRTGDLGRWLDDGEGLEVIGRVDRQLKLRGFRVEPAEVEDALAGHPGIAQAAVVAHEVSPGNTQLTAYYVRRAEHGPAEDQLSGDGLRTFLAGRLPGFMIPAEFIPLHQIPRAPDGEVDRQALTHPPTVATGNRDSEPLTPTQAGLSYLWSRILGRGPVGLDDDFFALGGNSLLAAEMLAHTRVMFGIGPGYVRPLTRSLLRDATLRGFAAATHAARAGNLSHDQHIDFVHEAELDHPVRPAHGSPPHWRNPRKVLLTGVTGFFGVHLLRELLASTAAVVHCLVRADDGSHAMDRITAAVREYAVGGLDLRRVVPVPGDLAEPRLGLSTGEFCALARTADVIYHAGALVNFVYPYAELRSANVTGTRELIRMATLLRGIPVHFVSTTAVLAGFGAMGVREVTEDTPLAYADRLYMGYLETKFVAEELLRNAGRAGLPMAVYRPLDIVADRHGGAWNTATEMCALIRFMTDTGLGPDIDLPLDFVPADVCAAAITHISTRVGATGETYHLSSPRYALLGSLIDRMRRHGFPVDTVPYDEWVGELVKYAASNPAHPMTPFVPLFVDRCADSELTVAEMYLEHVFPAYTRTHLEDALDGSGITFPPVDDQLLDVAIDRLIATGYLRTPAP